jgi:hypothetical protein
MKKLVFILFLFPALLSAQKDNAVQTFKISKSRIFEDNKYHVAKIYNLSSGKVAISSLLSAAKLTTPSDSCKIMSFTLSIIDSSISQLNCNYPNSIAGPWLSDNDSLTLEMMNIINHMAASSNCIKAYLKFSDIKYMTLNGGMGKLNDITLMIIKE